LKDGYKLRKDIDRALIREADTTSEGFQNNKGVCHQDLRVNKHMGAGGAITLGRIQARGGATTLVLSFKTTTRATAAISKQKFKIVCFADSTAERLTVDKDASLGGKQIPSAQRRIRIIVYKTSMHQESQLNLAPCGIKADPMTRFSWLIGTLRQLE